MDIRAARDEQHTYHNGNLITPQPVGIAAGDGYLIKGFCWRHTGTGSGISPVVIINPATSVRCRYYFRFAGFLFRNGFDVITYDYRGIGESRPGKLRGFKAGWMDWGRLDFDAVIRYAVDTFHGQPVYVVAHSVGGFILGLAPSSHMISRIFTMGAQYAYWRDYAPGSRLKMILKWHLIMPLITILFGYFPGKRLGWMEDTPEGVVWDWVLSGKRFEDRYSRLSSRYVDKAALMQSFTGVTAPTLAVSVTDDEFGTVPAVERLLDYYKNSDKTHIRISPSMIDETVIGHFGFFNSRYEEKLWNIPLEWLRHGKLPDECPGELIRVC